MTLNIRDELYEIRKRVYTILMKDNPTKEELAEARQLQAKIPIIRIKVDKNL